MLRTYQEYVNTCCKIKRTKTKHEFNIQPYFGLFYRVRWNPYKHIQISEISVLPDLPNTGLSKLSGTQNSTENSYKYGGYI
jgi:hypothetical protein